MDDICVERGKEMSGKGIVGFRFQRFQIIDILVLVS